MVVTKMETATQTQDVDEVAPDVICTRAGFRAGMRAVLPLSIGAVAWGVSFGVVAGSAGFSDISAALMSLLVYSGSAQIIAMDMVRDGAGLLAILGATLLISLRYILMGLTMNRWFRGTPSWLWIPGVQYTSDQSWAMTTNYVRHRAPDVGYFFGVNTVMVIGWMGGTAAGSVLGAWLDSHVQGLQFASTAALIGIVAEMRTTRSDIVPWIGAAIAAVAAERWIDGQWYMLIGVIVGMSLYLVQTGWSQ